MPNTLHDERPPLHNPGELPQLQCSPDVDDILGPGTQARIDKARAWGGRFVRTVTISLATLALTLAALMVAATVLVFGLALGAMYTVATLAGHAHRQGAEAVTAKTRSAWWR